MTIYKTTDSSIRDFIKDIHLYEQFLSFATLEEIRCFEICLYDKTNYQESHNGERFDLSCQLIFVQTDYVVPKPKKFNNFLFNYDTIKESYAQMLEKWYGDTVTFAPIRQHMIESIKHKKVFTSVDFLIVIQAIEGFYIRYRGSKGNTYNAVKNLTDEFSDVDKIKNNNLNFQQAVDSRHYYSHFMEKHKKANVLDGWELYELTAKLRKLLICCLLNFIGFDNSWINEILDTSNSHILE